MPKKVKKLNRLYIHWYQKLLLYKNQKKIMQNKGNNIQNSTQQAKVHQGSNN